jgi:two-component system, sensor histidine kinase and response regulator
VAKILIVDDDGDNVTLLREMLGGAGHQTLAAFTGPEAVAAARAADPDLILLDVLMPGMDGFQVCRQLRADPGTSVIPVVLVTILDDIKDRVRGNEALADDFLSKPVDRMELLSRVNSLLRLRALQHDLQRSNERLHELAQAKDRLTQMIVHDLKAPLTVVTTGVKYVAGREGGKLSGMGQSLLAQAEFSGAQLAQMVDNLLDITRMEEGELRLNQSAFPLGPFLLECVRAIRPPATLAEIGVDARLPADLPPAYGDKEILRRVVENLLHNALKFTPPGGQVWAEVCLGEPAATPGSPRDLQVRIRDTGRGIPKGSEHKIFEKFAQVETDGCGDRRGTGLGLTFCKMAVEAHGGAIWVESIEGEGSTFTFTLRSCPPQVPGEEVHSHGQEDSRRG